MSAERAIEIRKIGEPHIERYRADVATCKAWVAEHSVCAREPLPEDERREGEAFALEELVDVARRHAVGSRDLRDRQITVAEMRADISHYRPQPRGGDAASLRNRA